MKRAPLTIRLFDYAADNDGIITEEEAMRHTRRSLADVSRALAQLEEGGFLSTSSLGYVIPCKEHDGYRPMDTAEPTPIVQTAKDAKPTTQPCRETIHPNHSQLCLDILSVYRCRAKKAVLYTFTRCRRNGVYETSYQELEKLGIDRNVVGLLVGNMYFERHEDRLILTPSAIERIDTKPITLSDEDIVRCTESRLETAHPSHHESRKRKTEQARVE